ncbi:uncharacterized protein [Physcomitrium patens]|uniref:uncharacterized protein isoform X3 n=1 Tax=Physcomitrium patens TaxID=3218 RepID=UPI000D15580C|nr:uncharacterized protein LOC112291723 isoform X3 [Physcomitrium patens]|eukprot:XP_024395311.1 uncharacterized protein LOC112291723 isoform X3 [Physcomitrella patens]
MPRAIHASTKLQLKSNPEASYVGRSNQVELVSKSHQPAPRLLLAEAFEKSAGGRAARSAIAAAKAPPPSRNEPDLKITHQNTPKHIKALIGNTAHEIIHIAIRSGTPRTLLQKDDPSTENSRQLKVVGKPLKTPPAI